LKKSLCCPLKPIFCPTNSMCNSKNYYIKNIITVKVKFISLQVRSLKRQLRQLPPFLPLKFCAPKSLK